MATKFEKASRLYEQKRRACAIASPLEMYVRRWLRWTKSGMTEERVARTNEVKRIAKREAEKKKDRLVAVNLVSSRCDMVRQ